MGQYTKIDDASSHFQIINWTGNTTTPRDITHTGNSDLKPDIHWGKTVNSAGTDHRIYDSNRGLGTERSLQPNSNNPEATGTTYGIISHFLTDGFTTAAGGTNDDNYNENGKNHIAFSWKVNGGTTASNTDGDVTTTVQVNQNAGISIVTWGGANTNNKDIGHGLGQSPDMILIRNRTRTEDWGVFHREMGGSVDRFRSNSGGLRLNETDAVNLSATTLFRASPTTSVFEVGSDYRNNGDYPFVAYVFARSQGFSHFGRYKGNGQSAGNGPFVWCGFKPNWVMIKPNSGGVAHWFMHDSVRSPTNVMDDYLAANTNSVQGTSSTLQIDFVSNGFKIRGNNNTNFANTNYIFWAMAEAPFVSGTGVPTTAK
jgi:hypothetical protein